MCFPFALAEVLEDVAAKDQVRRACQKRTDLPLVVLEEREGPELEPEQRQGRELAVEQVRARTNPTCLE